MKKYILLFLLCLPMAFYAQVQSKYLEGAVPVVDGKVTFSQKLHAKGLPKEKLYSLLLDWANNRFQPQENTNSRVLYSNEDEGRIVVGGDDFIVFTSSYIVKDESRIYYHLIFDCEDNACNLTMTRIHYLYEESRDDGGYRYKAEEWITDKHGLTKSKDKLAKISGKFRRETIDYKDKLFTEVQNFLNEQVISSLDESPAVAAVPEKKAEAKEPAVKPVTAEPKATPVEPAPAVVAIPKPEAKKQESIPTDNKEEAIKKANRMAIATGKGEQFEIGKESWGGFGEMFGKKVVFCLIDTQKEMSNMLMLQLQEYTLLFYSEGNTSPCAVIKCKKMMQQGLKGKEAKNMNPDCDESKSYNMYVGEIIEE